MGLEGDFHDLPDGTVRLDLSDGSSTLMSGRAADAHLLWQRTHDGTEFTFDNGGELPTHVEFPDGRMGDYTYFADGHVRLTLDDGSVTLLSGSGPDAYVISQTTPDGDVYSDFDTAGNPGHVVFH